MSDQWRDVVEQEQRQRDQRAAKYHGTEEVVRLEQDAARDGHLPPGHEGESTPGLLARIKKAIMGIFGKG